MPEAPPLTAALADRIEHCIAHAHFSSGDGPEADAVDAVFFGRTVALRSTRGRPRNEVFRFGRDDIHRLPEILDFYASVQVEPRIFLGPTGFSGDVATALSEAGFRQCDYEQGILYGLSLPDPPTPPASTTIEPVTRGNLDEYVQALADGFTWPPEWREAAMRNTRDGFPGTAHSLLARFDGQAVGVGSVTVDDGGVARLGGGAVVPEFRRRGIHLALVRHRLHVAHEAGCNLVLSSASFGSASFANQQRAGLRLAYIECEWRRDAGPGHG